MKKKLLLLLPQSPFDPTSGAPRSMLSICRMLVNAGWQVQTMCTTAFDSGGMDAETWHARLGYESRMTRPANASLPVWQLTADGIEHNLLDTGSFATLRWEESCGGDFKAALAELLTRFVPDALLTYGGTHLLMDCRAMVREKGAAVVVGLRNHGHFVEGALLYADRGLAPSQWLASKYEDFLKRPVDGLPSPLIEADILPDKRDDVFYTFVNPRPHKGMMFFARLADELSKKRPDIPLLIVDSQGTCEDMLRAALGQGIDLRKYENVMLASRVTNPKDYLRVTRAILMTSLWEEPSGRVAAEAHLCGIPALVSDRGGLPENVAQAGIVLPIPKEIDYHNPSLPPVHAVIPWIDAIERLTDDETFYNSACQQAAKNGLRYREKSIAPQYVTYFETLTEQRHTSMQR